MPVRKAERLVNLIVYLLETNKPVKPDEIRRTIPGYDQDSDSSFQRMFERDKENLREMGIPIELQPTDVFEDEFGYRIPKERYYLPDIQLPPAELAALWMAASLLRLPDPSSARTALLKLSGDLPADDARSALSWLAADVGMSVKGLPQAFQAVAERRAIQFGYRSSAGKTRARKVDPYGLVHRRGAWYVVGRDREDAEMKSFRFDRMTGEIRLLTPSSAGGEFEIPESFRPETALGVPPFVKGEDPMRARVHFDAATAWRVERECPWLDLKWHEDGRAESELEVTETSGFVSWVLAFGLGAEVIDPPELRRAVLERLEEICA